MGIFDGVLGGRPSAAGQGTQPAYNPMEAIVREVRELGLPLTLGSLMERGRQHQVPATQMANLSGLDVSGFTFTQNDVSALKSAAQSNALQLNLSGSNISGCVFRPASTFNGCIIDECTTDHSNMTNLQFEGLTEPAHLAFNRVDVSGLAVSGAGDATASRNVNLSLEGCTAENMNIAGSKLTHLCAEGSQLDGLNATGARSLKLEVAGGSLKGASFEGVSFAPDSHIAGADLTGASFKGADISQLELRDVTLNPQALYGAYDGTKEINAGNVAEFMAGRGLQKPEMGMADARRSWPATPEADKVEAALVAAHSASSGKLQGGQETRQIASVASLPNARPEAGAQMGI